MQRGLGITFVFNVGNVFFLQVMVKRKIGIKHEEKTEKQQRVIITENNYFKGFTKEIVRNYEQK